MHYIYLLLHVQLCDEHVVAYKLTYIHTYIGVAVFAYRSDLCLDSLGLAANIHRKRNSYWTSKFVMPLSDLPWEFQPARVL